MTITTLESKHCPTCGNRLVVDPDPEISTVKRAYSGTLSNPKEEFKCVKCGAILKYTRAEVDEK